MTLGKDVLGRTVGVDTPFLQHHQPVAVLRREIEIVGHTQYGEPVAGAHVAKQIEDLDLVVQVQEGGRFVQEKDRWLLRQCTGDDDALPFAAGQFVYGAVPECKAVGPPHGFEGDFPVFGTFSPEALQVGRPAHHDDVQRGEGEGHGRQLGDDGDLARDLPDGVVLKRRAVEYNASPAQRQDARECPDQRALAGPVRPDHAQHLALAQIEGQIFQNRTPVVTAGQVFHADGGFHAYGGFHAHTASSPFRTKKPAAP